MTDPSEEFHHAGIVDVKEYTNSSGGVRRMIRLPDRIIGREHPKAVEILEPGKPVYWSYDKAVKTVIISNADLQKPEYKYVTTSNFSESSNFRTTVPEQFFADFEGGDKYDLQSPVPEKARFEPGEDRHFIYSTAMAEGRTRSCYVLTEKQFSIQFSDSGRWDGDLSQVPKFIS